MWFSANFQLHNMTSKTLKLLNFWISVTIYQILRPYQFNFFCFFFLSFLILFIFHPPGITDLNDIKYQVASQELPDGEFTVSQNGDVLVMKELDFETRQNYSFHVMVSNGRHRDLCLVNIRNQ